MSDERSRFNKHLAELTSLLAQGRVSPEVSERAETILANLERAAERCMDSGDERYKALFEIAGDALFIENEHDEILEVNTRACELLGYTREELLGLSVSALQAPEIRGRAGSILTEELSRYHGHPFETVDIARDGTRIPVEVTNTRLDAGGVFLSIVRDIRDRRSAQAARTETYQIIEKSPAVAFLWRNEPHWPVEFVTHNVSRLLGHTREDFLTRRVSYRDVVHADDLERVEAEVRLYDSQEGRTEFTHVPYRIVTADGETRWVDDSTYIRRDAEGRITHHQGIVVDITNVKETTEQLQAEKERLAVTLRSIGDAVITIDREGRILLMNHVAENLTGWSEPEAVGRDLAEVFRAVDEQSGAARPNPVNEVIGSARPVKISDHSILLSRNGREYHIENRGAPVVDSSGEAIGVVMVFRDTTEQLRMEDELLKMEKLQSLGVLAGGIAHDFNNFLAGIVGNLSVARLDVEPGSQLSQALGAMEKAALRARELTNQLLTFSKGGEPVRQVTDLAALIADSTEFALRGTNVKLELTVEEGLHHVYVDEGQIAQVFHNLMLNAVQAMPEGGTVRLRAVNTTLAVDNSYAAQPGQYVRLSIQDDGTGIAAEDIRRVFDPYFTTKGSGSGLGLAVAHSIVSKHGGKLTVESEVGRGTVFVILLPASSAPLVPREAAREGSATPGGRVLIMDDEEFIRTLMARMLERLGYEPVVVSNGEEVIEQYHRALEGGHRFDAVILDLTVRGGMGGRETIQELTRIDPSVRAIVSSGYSNDPVMANHAEFGFCAAVQKPFRAGQIARVLALATGHD